MVEGGAVDDADCAHLHAPVPLGVVRDDGDRPAAERRGDLQGHGPEAARCAPYQHRVAGLDCMRRPAHQHPVGCRGAKQVAARLLPGQVLRAGLALVRLRLRELAVGAVVGLVAPDAGRGRQHRILAREHPRVVRLPPAGMDHHLVAGPDVRDLRANRLDDAGAVAAAGMEIFRLALAHPLLDDVDRVTERRPDIVVVDARRHDIDEHLVGLERRNRNDLMLPGVLRFAEPVLAHEEGMHRLGHFAERRLFAQSAEFHRAGSFIVSRRQRYALGGWRPEFNSRRLPGQRWHRNTPGNVMNCHGLS